MGVLIKASGMSAGKRRDIYRRSSAGELTKLAPGIFAPQEVLESVTPWRLYQLRCAAMGYAYPKFVLVGKSSAAVQNIPYGAVPAWVEMARARGPGGLTNELVMIRGLAALPGQTVQKRFGLNVTTPLHTVLDMGRWHPLGDSVTATDHCLHENVFTLPYLEEYVSQLKGIHGINRLKDLVLLAHGASESPRESALRVAMWENGFPAPELQASIVNGDGRFLGRVDALFAAESVLVEYDGRDKYAQSTEKALMEERRREKDLLNLGTRMIRVSAETFADGGWIPALRRELELGRNRPLPLESWASKGLGWGSLRDKQPHGSAYSG